MARSDIRAFAEVISWLFGWLYFLAWSGSFYPQPLLNYRRRSVLGLTPDFPMLNVVGFGSYSLSTLVFMYSSIVRKQYAARHPHSPEPTVRFNDLAFGIHGFVLCCITFSQFWPHLWRWKPSRTRPSSTKITLAVMNGSFCGVIITVLIVLSKSHGKGEGDRPGDWAWLDVVYSLMYVKLILTIFKYVPQVVSNYRRKSTVGWSIMQVLLDFTGGILSLAQLTIDSALQADWSGMTGNPVKLGLANISLLFDVIFMVQHYVLYGPMEEKIGRPDLERADNDDSRPSTEEDALLPAQR